jgi:hypothetical protein
MTKAKEASEAAAKAATAGIDTQIQAINLQAESRQTSTSRYR